MRPGETANMARQGKSRRGCLGVHVRGREASHHRAYDDRIPAKRPHGPNTDVANESVCLEIIAAIE